MSEPIEENRIFYILNIASEFFGLPIQKPDGRWVLEFERPSYRKEFEKVIAERFGLVEKNTCHRRPPSQNRVDKPVRRKGKTRRNGFPR